MSLRPEAPSGSASGDYRPALDGVRAAAVLAVIIYHVGNHVRGGFLGVDVFFVLSGYLITTLLLREHAAHGRVHFGEFWFRRIRRLFPALLVLVAVIAAVIAATAPVIELSARRGDMLSTLFYSANWHFIATDASYFAQYTGASPLRHTWSLAIEEQFYVVWPLVIAGLLTLKATHRLRLLSLLIVLGVVASATDMAASYSAINPSRSYYGTDSRVFELLIGAGLAVLLVARPTALTSDRSIRIARWAWPPGIVVLAAFVLLMYDDDGVYYRGGALIFALCVATVLWTLETLPRSFPARGLSWRPVCWIGVISYGLYLWHWPMLLWIGDSGRLQQAAVILATFAAASVSFYVVERPIRAGRLPWLTNSRWRLVGALAVLLLLVTGGALKATHIDSSNLLLAQVSDISDIPCPNEVSDYGSPVWCRLVDADSLAAPVIATAGDSTSRALTPGLEVMARERGWDYVQAGQSGCSILPLPIANSADDAASVAQARACAGAASKLINGVERDFHPDLWIVSDRILLGDLVLPGADQPATGRRRDELLVSSLTKQIDRLGRSGAAVATVAMPPPAPPVDCADEPTPECEDISHTLDDKPTAHLNELLKRAVSRSNADAAFISLNDVLCPADGRCPVAIGGTLVRYDGIHLTAGFSRALAPELIARILRAGLPIGPHQEQTAPGPPYRRQNGGA